MANFFNDLLAELLRLLRDWPIGTFIGVVILLLIAAIVGLILYGIYKLVDSAWIQVERAQGVVISKDVSTAPFTYVVVSGSNVAVPTGGGTCYSLLIKVGDEDAWCPVSFNAFDTTQRGDTLTVDVGHGRLSGKLYIKNIY